MTTFHLVATFQDYENYGAHQWDGEGECPQYWKAKGSSERVVATLSIQEVTDLGSKGLRALVDENAPNVYNDYFESTLIDWELVTIDSDLLDRVRASKEEQAEFWGNDDYLYMAVATDLRIPETAARLAFEALEA